VGKPFKKRVNVASQCSSWSALISGPSARSSQRQSAALEPRLGSFVDKVQNLTGCGDYSYAVIYLDVVNIYNIGDRSFWEQNRWDD
jgi:hypothetical protein